MIKKKATHAKTHPKVVAHPKKKESTKEKPDHKKHTVKDSKANKVGVDDKAFVEPTPVVEVHPPRDPQKSEPEPWEQ